MQLPAKQDSSILVVDDEPAIRRLLVRWLQTRGYTKIVAENGSEAMRIAAQASIHLAIVDLCMPELDGMALLGRLKSQQPQLEVLLMTAQGDIDTAVAAIKAGARDFLTKPFPSQENFLLSIERAMQHGLSSTLSHVKELGAGKHGSGTRLLGTSRAMRQLLAVADQIAPSDATVLLSGESGTGKELVARYLHEHSKRAQQPMVVVNCGAIPANLVESELFGHVKGAFTGAQSTRQGLFEAAHKGTLFLDEVADLPLSAQVKLLRVLQQGEVRRVGSDEARQVDVRVLAAANVSLQDRVRKGLFREDLYYRLNVINLELPPLRARREDIALLAMHFFEQSTQRFDRAVKTIHPDALALLESYDWPGNVRELEHAIERGVLLSLGSQLSPAALPPAILHSHEPPASSRLPALVRQSGTVEIVSEDKQLLPYMQARQQVLSLFEEEYLRRLTALCGQNISHAARVAGLDRSNFRRLLHRVTSRSGPTDRSTFGPQSEELQLPGEASAEEKEDGISEVLPGFPRDRLG